MLNGWVTTSPCSTPVAGSGGDDDGSDDGEFEDELGAKVIANQFIHEAEFSHSLFAVALPAAHAVVLRPLGMNHMTIYAWVLRVLRRVGIARWCEGRPARMTAAIIVLCGVVVSVLIAAVIVMGVTVWRMAVGPLVFPHQYTITQYKTADSNFTVLWIGFLIVAALVWGV